MKTFKVTRVFADENGDSHFEDINYPLSEVGPIGFLSHGITVKELVFRKVSPGYDDFHTAPQRQFVVLLDQGIEIENSLGENRSFRPGEILLMEDVTGKGHRSRNIKHKERNSLFIILAE
jgi:hypothetical protein